MAEKSQTGDQMLAALEIVASHGPVSASDVAKIGGFNRTVVHRLLTTLASRAYLRRSESGYVVGPAVIRLADVADMDLRKIALPVMRELAQETGETVVLHGIDNLEAIVIDQAIGATNLVRVEHSPGSRHPLFKGASGWAILSFQNENFVARATKGENAQEISAHINKVRADGYAISHDELQQGVHGLAVPILTKGGTCEASLAILVPVTRADRLASLPDRLAAATKLISSLLN